MSLSHNCPYVNSISIYKDIYIYIEIYIYIYIYIERANEEIVASPPRRCKGLVSETPTWFRV